MSTGALVDLIVTVLAGVLVAVIGYLLKGRFDTQDATLGRVEADLVTLSGRVGSVERDVVRLTEAQRAVLSSQSASSRAMERLLDDGDELADKCSQLDALTHRLYDRMEASDQLLAALRGETGRGG